MIPQLRLKLTDALDDRQQLVNGVVAELIAGSVGALAFSRYFHLHAAFVPTIDLHLGRFTNDHTIGPDLWINLDKGIRRNAVAPFLHVAEVIGRPTVEPAQIAGDGQAIHHARCAVFLVARPTGIQNAIFDLANKGVPCPRCRVADADSVDMRVEHDHPWPAADAPDGVAHCVEAHFVKI